MNKKQLIVTWSIAILLIILLGIETRIITGESTKFHLNSMDFYGFQVIRYDTPIFGYVVNLGHYKFYLIFCILIIGGLLIYTLRDKTK